MEFSALAAGIDFSHYSEYPDEYMEVGSSSGYYHGGTEREDDLDSTERTIQEQLIRRSRDHLVLVQTLDGEEGKESAELCLSPNGKRPIQRRWPDPCGSGVECSDEDDDDDDEDEMYSDEFSDDGECIMGYVDEDEIPRKRNRMEVPVEMLHHDDDDDEDEDDDFSCSTASSSSDGDRPVMVAASTEMLRIRFPFQSISIRLSDYLALQEGDTLSDAIIDFYLNHIVEHLLPDEADRRVTVLPSLFWHNLSLKKPIVKAENEEEEEEKRDESDAARFGDLLDFVGEQDLIDVDYIVVPVCEWEHWSMVVIVKPFTSAARILCFDSAQAHDPNDLKCAAQLIAQFFQYAHEQQRGGGGEAVTGVGHIVPRRLPQQPVTKVPLELQSGIYAVEYLRRFLLQPPAKIGREFDFSREYRNFSVEDTRQNICKAVLSLSTNRGAWEKLLSVLKPAIH